MTTAWRIWTWWKRRRENKPRHLWREDPHPGWTVRAIKEDLDKHKGGRDA